MGAETVSLGETGIAAVSGADSAFLNPATFGFFQKSAMSFAFGVGQHPTFGTKREYAAALVDGDLEKPFQGGLAFSQSTVEVSENSKYTLKDFVFGLGHRSSERFSYGLSVHRAMFDQQVGDEGHYGQTNAGLGVLWVPSEHLGLAAVASNIISGQRQDVLAAARLIPTYVVGAHAILSDFFRVRFDLKKQDRDSLSRWNYGIGVESFFRPEMVFRVGWAGLETQNQSKLTLGVAFKGPRLSFDYSFDKDVRVEGGTRHLIDIWLPL